MRALLLVPVAVILVAACGFAMTKALGISFAPKEVMTAALACTVAGMLATIPLLVTRHSAQPVVMQAALIGTVIHMLVSLGAAGVVIIGKLGLGASFVYWLFAFYFATLIVVAVAFAGAVRSAPAQAPKA